jgi:hypothetical protein
MLKSAFQAFEKVHNFLGEIDKKIAGLVPPPVEGTSNSGGLANAKLVHDRGFVRRAGKGRPPGLVDAQGHS